MRLPVKLELLPPVEGGAPEAELFVQNVIVPHVQHEVEVVVESTSWMHTTSASAAAILYRIKPRRCDHVRFDMSTLLAYCL